MLKSRFELFAAASLAIHAGVFAGMVIRRGAVPPAPGAGTAAAGEGAAAVPGETFDVPELEEAENESPPGGDPTPIEIDGPATTPPAPNGDAPAARPAKSARGVAPHPAGGAPAPPPPASYGAVGDRTAGDLVTTFKKVFPLAVSNDPLWDRIPVGFYAEGDVTFYLAEDGSLTHATASASAAPAFRAAVLRTTQLLKHRLFTAKGATTHTHMVVRVTDRLTNHGAFTVDAAGAFELPSGRHVSVTVVEK